MNNNTLLKQCLVIGVLAVLQSPAEEVLITGMVKSQDQAPVNGANLRLSHYRTIEATTNSSGEFTLSGSTDLTALSRGEDLPGRSFPVLSGGALTVQNSASNSAAFSFSLFSCAGAKVTGVQSTLSPGSIVRLMPPSGVADGAYIAEVSENGSVSRTLVAITSGRYTARSGIAQTMVNESVRSRAAAAAVIDTVIVTAAGYQPASVPIEGYTVTLSITLTANATSDINPYGAGLNGHPYPTRNPVTGATVTLQPSGGDDRPAIQAAIDNAGQGDEVFLQNGTYQLSSATGAVTQYEGGTLNLKSGVNVRGESREGVVLVATAFGSSIIHAGDVQNAVLSDLTIIPPSIGQAPQNGIQARYYAAGCFNLYFENIALSNWVRRGIRLNMVHDCVVKNCTITNPDGDLTQTYAIEIIGSQDGDMSGTAKDTYFNIIEGCSILGNTFEYGVRHAIIVQDYAHNNLISNNLVDKIAYGAIEFHADGEYLNEVTGNLTTNCRTMGIKVLATSGLSNYIHDNTVRNCPEGITVDKAENAILVENLIE